MAIVELGGAAAWDLKGGGSSFGPDLAVEFTPIENWLEIEAGVTPLFGRRSTEWDADLLFRKPWTLSERVEFMVGLGPEWIHTRENGMTPNSLGGEVVLYFHASGPPPSIDSAGTWSRATITVSGEGMSARWASAEAC